MDPQNTQGAGAQPVGQNPQGQGQTQPPQGMPQQGAGQSQPQGGMPTGMYPPQGYQQGGMPGAYPQGMYPQMPQQGYPQGGMPPGMYPPQGYPQGGMYPDMGQGFGGDMGMGGAQGFGAGGMPPQEPEDTTPANFPLGTKFVAPLKIKLPKHDMSFDDAYFVKLLAGSISLSREEKKRIIESVPKLKQSQIDELINIFEEEKEKFAALSKKHVPQLEKLAQQHYDEWMDLETEHEQSQKKNEDQDKAEAIRKQLGL